MAFSSVEDDAPVVLTDVASPVVNDSKIVQPKVKSFYTAKRKTR